MDFKQKRQELLDKVLKRKIESMQERDEKHRRKREKAEKGTISYGLFTRQPVRDFIRDNIERRKRKREEK